MKVIYLIKKGLQYYPPCLTQILYLEELGVDLEVFHGKNSEYINQLLDTKNIKHYTFVKDRQSRNQIDRVFNFISFSQEIKAIQRNLPKNSTIWIGNLETAMTLDKELLKQSNFILNVLELYDERTIYDRWLKKMIKYASVVNCCEKHRAAIMQSRYSLKSIPFVIPNKPFDLKQDINLPLNIKNIIDEFNEKFIILYQGVIAEDRPIKKIANALANIGDNSMAFLYMGRCDNRLFPDSLKYIYPNTYYLGYIPAPQHLAITNRCHLGIASYDFSNLNNVFCAPNKIYEYSRFGKPMLTSLNIGLTETVGACGAAECVDFNDVDEIAQGILKIKKNYKSYSAAANAFYHSVDMKKLIENVLHKLDW